MYYPILNQQRPQKLLEVASHCLKTGLYTDVTFIVGERKFPAHRLVMDSISDYFKSLFKVSLNLQKLEKKSYLVVFISER